MSKTLAHGLRWTVVAMGCLLASDAQTPGRAVAEEPSSSVWKLGAPIVTYWAGPAITDRVARQMADGGWNLVWCTTEKELDVAQRHGLRAQFQSPLISPKSLDDPAKREQLDALIERVRKHPALYSYYVRDEPCATDFAALARTVAYLRQRDPAHLAYINLFPVYASNEQLGTKGDAVVAYREHLRQYIDVVKPSLLSYDNYPFMDEGVRPDYFLNLALIRQASLDARLPFLNIVQAGSWEAGVRIPTGNEMRYLVYTTLAYGAQGISYFVYCHPDIKGGIAQPDGTPTPIYEVLKSANREFAAIAAEVRPLVSLGVYHAGMTPPGAQPLAADAPFRFDPAVAQQRFENGKPVKGMLLGLFGRVANGTTPASPTLALAVNLDCTADAAVNVVGPRDLEVFDATTGKWSAVGRNRTELHLPPGGGKLLRCQTSTDAQEKR